MRSQSLYSLKLIMNYISPAIYNNLLVIDMVYHRLKKIFKTSIEDVIVSCFNILVFMIEKFSSLLNFGSLSCLICESTEKWHELIDNISVQKKVNGLILLGKNISECKKNEDIFDIFFNYTLVYR